MDYTQSKRDTAELRIMTSLLTLKTPSMHKYARVKEEIILIDVTRLDIDTSF